MALEVGGRADKEGNQYENHFLGKHLLRLAEEKLKSIEVEPLGDEGQGVEYIAVKPDDTRIYYQCKAANAAKSYWSIIDFAEVIYTVIEQAAALADEGPVRVGVDEMVRCVAHLYDVGKDCTKRGHRGLLAQSARFLIFEILLV